MVPSPAIAPEIMPSTEGFRRVDHSSAAQVAAPAQAARCVAMIAITARGLAVSAEPPLKPNQPTHSDAGADDRERQIVRRQILGAVAVTLADHFGRDQAADAGGEMHDEAAGEIQHAHGGEKTAAPHPMRQRHIDER